MYPPYNLGIIAKHVKNRGYINDIKILDGNINSEQEIISHFKNGIIVGFTCTILNYKSTLKLCKIAKTKYHVQTIVGGTFAKYFINEIYVDYVVEGEGCQFFDQYYIQKQSYRNKKKYFYFEDNLLENRVPSYSSLNINVYFDNFKKIYANKYKSFTGGLPYSPITGCYYSYLGNKCSFCSIDNQFKPKRLKPEIFWKSLKEQYQAYSNDFFWITSDSFTSNNKWLKDLVKEKKKLELNNIQFEVYGRVNEINEQNVKLLKELNVYSIFLGVESGSDTLLKNENKGINVKMVLNAISLLNQYNIYVIPGFIIGLIGETNTTIGQTLKLAEKISNFKNVEESSVSILLPIPGSKDHITLTKEIKCKELINDNPFILKKNWLDNFTEISYKDALKATNQIKQMYNYSGGGF